MDVGIVPFSSLLNRNMVSFWIHDIKHTVSNAVQMQHLHIKTSRFPFGGHAFDHILQGSSLQSCCCPSIKPLFHREWVRKRAESHKEDASLRLTQIIKGSDGLRESTSKLILVHLNLFQTGQTRKHFWNRTIKLIVIKVEEFCRGNQKGSVRLLSGGSKRKSASQTYQCARDRPFQKESFQSTAERETS